MKQLSKYETAKMRADAAWAEYNALREAVPIMRRTSAQDHAISVAYQKAQGASLLKDIAKGREERARHV